MSSFIRVLLLLGVMLYSLTGSAAVVSNFEAIYDITNGRILYTFDLDPVDATTTSGVDQIYFNYNPQNPPAPFIGSTTLLDSSVSGTTFFVFDIDEINFTFPSPLTSPTSVAIILGGVDPASMELGSYELELYVNTSYFTPPSTLIQQYLGVVETQDDLTIGTVPPDLGPSAPTQAIPTMSTYGLVLTILGLLFVASRRLRVLRQN